MSIIVYYQIYDPLVVSGPKTILAQNSFPTSPDFEHTGELDVGPLDKDGLKTVRDVIMAIALQEDCGDTYATAWADVGRTQSINGFLPTPRKGGPVTAGTRPEKPLIIYFTKLIEEERWARGGGTSALAVSYAANADC